MRNAIIHPRYQTHLESSKTNALESDGVYKSLEWDLPVSSLALVLVDVWNWDYLEDVWARDEEIVQRGILPVLGACRKAGITIIHAPCSIVADKYPQFRHPFVPDKTPPSWPPKDFLSLTGEFAALGRPHSELTEKIREHSLHHRDMHPLVRPLPGEIVVGNDGAELHAVLEAKKSLVLLYVGFHANLCLIGRDYGVPTMLRRGYQIIVLTDCVNAIETAATLQGHKQARAMEEMFSLLGSYVMHSTDLIGALTHLHPDDSNS